MARRPVPRPELRLSPAEPNGGPSVTEGVLNTLKESILSGQLACDTPLIESQLAERFGVSKTPVREALLRLAQAGLVDLAHTRGATVHTPTRRETRDIFELRILLEPQALAAAAPYLKASDLEESASLLRQAQSALKKKDVAALSRLNIEFHRSLYAECPNRILVGWLDSLSDRRRLLSLRGWARDDRSLEEWHEHTDILGALRAGNVSLACERLRDHISRFASLLLKE